MISNAQILPKFYSVLNLKVRILFDDRIFSQFLSQQASRTTRAAGADTIVDPGNRSGLISSSGLFMFFVSGVAIATVAFFWYPVESPQLSPRWWLSPVRSSTISQMTEMLLLDTKVKSLKRFFFGAWWSQGIWS